MGLEKLIELAKKIENKDLREKTIQILKDIKLTHPKFEKYPREDPEKVKTPFGSDKIFVFRELINHTLSVTETCIEIARIVKENYKINVNLDFLIAGALLHDIMKVYEFKDGKHTGILLDHSALGLAELYKREFPEEVLHMIISHQGASTNPPKTIEALILHHVDTMLSLIEFSSYQQFFINE